MGCCNAKASPSTLIDLSEYEACSASAHLQDMFVYLPEERLGVVPCDSTRFSVNYQLIEAMTFMFVVTDNLTGFTVSYSVVKESLTETPESAFKRDYLERELRYNRGIKRALEDHTEALSDTDVPVVHTLEQYPGGWRITRPINPSKKALVFSTEYTVIDQPLPLDLSQADLIGFEQNVGEVWRSLERLIKRFQKLGVIFESAVSTMVGESTVVHVLGRVPRTESSHIEVLVSYRSSTLTDQELLHYHNSITL